MIEYYKGAYSLNLLARAHGSATYKAILPGLLSIVVYLLLATVWNANDTYIDEDKPLRHPYAAGVLVSAVSFIIIFRANNSYQRYWEACGAVHTMMSKWLDAVVHTGQYHLQCKHFNGIKPPSYFDNHDLNQYHLTRDREREEDEMGDLPGPPNSLRSRSTSAESATGTGSGGRRLNNHRSGSGGMSRHEADMESRRRKVAKSIEYVDRPGRGRRTRVQSLSDLTGLGYPGGGNHGGKTNRPYGGVSLSSDDINLNEGSDRDWASEMDMSGTAHLLGRGRLDGGWGLLFKDDKIRGPTSTFYDIKSGDPFIDKKDPLAHGFSSTRGGRTPDLFLQELCHLASLCVAVAFCTLRNDIEGAASPLSTYHPGEPWPEVDVDKIPRPNAGWVPTWMLTKNIKYWFGMDRTQKARTEFNRTRPMPVIGGISENEIAFLQKSRGASAKTTMAWGWLSEFIIREHLAGSLGAVGPPIISRIFQFLSDGMIHYNHARKIMFIPFPFPHAQLTAVFTATLVFVVPLLMTEFTGLIWLGCLLTFLTVTCLFGLHEVAKELENPFRNIPNDIPLCTFLAQFNESLITILSGYHPDHYWDAEKFRRSYESQLSMVKEAPADMETNYPRNLSGAGSGTDQEKAVTPPPPVRRSNGGDSAIQRPQSTAADKKAQSTSMSLPELQQMIQEQALEIEHLKRAMGEKKAL
eukprot:CAMPEP_0181026208 /NCGR_PEP_ID=MMETSP1070-20121207/3514_1 /TAXON_ID=265543 /ORGANISM="Minutocellus polymorphus, Strain NH13" /LENGTH=692 /DNA_ID=CAMNT_0023103379 /DNA_START=331 /DNA_END=2412 /DNA_ORIENTATION=+